MTDLDDFARLISGEHGLCVVSTSRADGTVQSSVVNAGVLEHPGTGERVVGFVARGDARKLVNLRARGHATIVARVGWQWAAAEGAVDLAGPDDPLPGRAGAGPGRSRGAERADLDPEDLRLLLRAVFTAAGGDHDDWDTYDRVMAEERRTAVLLTPTRVYSNG